MSTDRELLEAAARAAGFKIKYLADYSYPILIDGDATVGWCPLKFDSDALRLAVKLGIHISQQLSYCATFCPHGDNSTRGKTLTENYNEDPYAATRRAIVRAAAKMAQERQ